MQITRNNSGYSMIEMIVVIIIIGILASVAMRSMRTVSDTGRTEQTKTELDQLAWAVAGNPDLASGGSRTDFGYVGDVGAMPPNLAALVNNPGGYATWDGPYIKDDFYASTGSAESEYGFDAWGVNYGFSGVTITSTGSGTTITRNIANSTADLLYNTVSAAVTDIDNTPPGTIYRDSVKLVLTYPDGSGSTAGIEKYPTANGFVQFNSVPIGLHTLRLIYLPTGDTMTRRVAVNTGEDYYTDLHYFANVWGDTSSGGGLEYVSGTAQTQTGTCDRIVFDITNTSGSSIDVSSMTVIWTSPVSYYRSIKWGGPIVYDQQNPQTGSGTSANFTGTQSIGAGATITIRLDKFEDDPNGGNKVDMSNTDMTVQFSDGSSISFNSGACN